MALINKISIRGIRAFNPDQEQSIEFFTPLTMIVGENGSGKTTIIECLKLSCTGSLPPGSRNGQAFVHDPKVSAKTEVKAQVKLRFKAQGGKTMVVVRSYQLTQKKTALQFKALDGVIRTKDEKGDTVAMSHKCSELDKQVPQYMGVSAAILENVIFCHQEESSWPLQEGAVVKKKFDDIFESSRYTKALDSIKKTKQEYQSKVKDLFAELKEVQKDKETADRYKHDLESVQEQFSSLKDEVAAIDENLKELEEKVNLYTAKAMQVQELQHAKRDVLSRIRELEAVIQEKRNAVGEPMTGTDEELQQQIDALKTTMDTRQTILKTAEAETQRHMAAIAAFKKERDVLNGKRGAAQSRLSEEVSVLRDRDAKISSLAATYDIFPEGLRGSQLSGGGASSAGQGTQQQQQFSESDVATFLKALRKMVGAKQDELKEIRQRNRQQMDELLKEMRKLETEKSTVVASAQAKDQELKAVTNEYNQLMAALQREKTVVPAEVTDAKRTAEQARRDLQQFEAKGQRAQLEARISELKKEQNNLLVDLKRDQEALEQHQQSMAEQSKVEAMDRQVRDDSARLEERVREVNDRVAPFMGGNGISSASVSDLEDATAAVKATCQERRDELKEKRRSLTDLQRALAEKDTLLKQARAERSRLQREHDEAISAGGPVEAIKETIKALNRECESSDQKNDDDENDPQVQKDANRTFREEEAEQALEDVKLRESRVVGVSIRTEGVKRFFKGFSEYFESKHKCPACKRGFSSEEEKAPLRDYITRRTSSADGEEAAKLRREILAKLTKQRDAFEKNLPAWRAWKERVPRLEEARKEVEDAETVAANAKTQVSTAEREVEEALAREAAASQVVGLVQELLNEANRIQSVSKSANNLRHRLQSYASAGDDRTYEEVQEAHKQHNEQKDRVAAELQDKLHEQTRVTSRHNVLISKSSEYDKEAKAMEAALEREQENKTRRDARRARMEALAKEVNDLRAKEAPVRQQLQAKEQHRDRMREQHRTEEDRISTEVDRCRAAEQDFAAVARRADEFVRQNNQRVLDEIVAQIQRTEEKIRATEAAREEGAKRCNVNLLSITNLSKEEAQLKANVDLRKRQREVDNLKARATKYDADVIVLLDNQDLERDLKAANDGISKNREKRAGKVGRREVLREQLREVQKRLAGKAYNNVGERCKLKQQEYTVTELAVHDLDKYWTALDRALLRYHKMKIADVNKSIHELWQTVYSGQDIEMIEIVSGEEGESTKARRSYNYRVAMHKGGTMLDMKGRCSAGQRVLASLVIRLALADNFCINCGILALDEPTTNLDENNKRGLANALSKLIATRQRQQNFQLVIITHDDDFVATMRDSLQTQAGVSMPENYYQISRELVDGKYYSAITRKDWDELPQG